MKQYFQAIRDLPSRIVVSAIGYHSDLTHRAFHKQEGAALVEYALLVALVAVVALTAIATLGSSTKEKLEAAASAIK